MVGAVQGEVAQGGELSLDPVQPGGVGRPEPDRRPTTHLQDQIPETVCRPPTDTSITRPTIRAEPLGNPSAQVVAVQVEQHPPKPRTNRSTVCTIGLWFRTRAGRPTDRGDPDTGIQQGTDLSPPLLVVWARRPCLSWSAMRACQPGLYSTLPIVMYDSGRNSGQVDLLGLPVVLLPPAVPVCWL